MGTVIALLSGRFGGPALVGAGLLAAGMAVAIGVLLVVNANLRTDVATEKGKVTDLTARIAVQNAAVETMATEADALRALANERALRALAPRPKANPRTAEEMDRWLAAP